MIPKRTAGNIRHYDLASLPELRPEPETDAQWLARQEGRCLCCTDRLPSPGMEYCECCKPTTADRGERGEAHPVLVAKARKCAREVCGLLSTAEDWGKAGDLCPGCGSIAYFDLADIPPPALPHGRSFALDVPPAPQPEPTRAEVGVQEPVCWECGGELPHFYVQGINAPLCHSCNQELIRDPVCRRCGGERDGVFFCTDGCRQEVMAEVRRPGFVPRGKRTGGAPSNPL